MRQFKFHSSIALGMVLLMSCCILACHPLPPTPKVPSSQQPSSTEQPVKGPAEFEVSSLTVNPSLVVAGGSATVSVNVRNTGDEGGVYFATLSLDGQLIDKKEISLMPQQYSIVEFTVNELTVGRHTISIGQSKVSIDVSPRPTKIAFVRYYGEYYVWEICTMASDGTNIERITNSASFDLRPAWSPNGTKIAFESTRQPHNLSSIYVMDADGKNIKCLTPEPKFCQFPAWSPDGRKIAYCVMRPVELPGGVVEHQPESIFIVNPDGSDKKCVVGCSGQSVGGWGPSWFPDSQRISFTSNYTGVWEIYSANIDGSEVRKHGVLRGRIRFPLREWPAYSEFPTLAVSPDGSSIAFEDVHSTQTRKADIYVLTIDTGEVTNLTHGCDDNSYCPTWSSDGKKIAFTSETSNAMNIEVDRSIHVMNADGTNLTKLIENGHWPAWQR